MKVAFYTLGCKTNQYETQGLERLFSDRGHTLVAFDAPADVYVVNTCTVTALADKKSRNACRRARRMSPKALLIVCGCYGQASPQAVQAATGADFVLGVTGRAEIVRLAEEALAGRRAAGESTILTRELWGPDARRPAFEPLPAGGLMGRTRALLKVQDGCQNFCTYCKIPYVRGPSRSAPLEAVAADAAALAREGYREVVITGIEISSWGDDLPGAPPLAALVEAVCRAAPEVRVRLGSLEPRTVDGDFAARLAGLPNLCPHFHLSLQSGCDRTLGAMNRRYTAGRYAESCASLRRFFPGCAITADLIVGFPGESAEDFEQSLATVEACALAGGHVFPFSPRAGTRAHDMPEQLGRAEKEARARRAGQVMARLEAAYLDSCVGRRLEVLFEERRGGLWVGHGREYVRVAVATQEDLAGQVRGVDILAAREGGLVGALA